MRQVFHNSAYILQLTGLHADKYTTLCKGKRVYLTGALSAFPNTAAARRYSFKSLKPWIRGAAGSAFRVQSAKTASFQGYCAPPNREITLGLGRRSSSGLPKKPYLPGSACRRYCKAWIQRAKMDHGYQPALSDTMPEGIGQPCTE